MGDRKIHAARIKAAYEAAVSAAMEVAKGELLDGSVTTVRSRMTWDYRWAEQSAHHTDVDVLWAEDEEEPEA